MVTLSLPAGRLHLDPACPHLRHARRHRVARVALLPGEWRDTCRDCWRREVRRAIAARRAADEAMRARYRAEAEADADAWRYVIERGRRA